MRKIRIAIVITLLSIMLSACGNSKSNKDRDNKDVKVSASPAIANTTSPTAAPEVGKINVSSTSLDDTGYWLTTTELEQGAKVEGSNYAGPYPPNGIHKYEIVVYALKQPLDKYPGVVDAPVDKYVIQDTLDTVNGTPGNIPAKGMISGKVGRGIEVK